MITYVIELQSGDVSGSAIPMAYADLPDAEEKYHQILQYAAKSEVRKHGAVMVDENGFVLKQEVYHHPEPYTLESIGLEGS